MDIVRKNIEADPENGFTKAVKEAITHNVLKEYLARKAKEVINMLTVEYDYATDIEVQREEAAREAMLIGEQKKALKTAENLKRMGLSADLIAQATELPLAEIAKL